MFVGKLTLESALYCRSGGRSSGAMPAYGSSSPSSSFESLPAALPGAAAAPAGLVASGFDASGFGDSAAGGAAVVGGAAGAGVFTGIAATVDVRTGALSIAVVAAIAATAATPMANRLRTM